MSDDLVTKPTSATHEARRFLAAASKGGKPEEMQLRAHLAKVCDVADSQERNLYELQDKLDGVASDNLTLTRRYVALRTQHDTLTEVNRVLSDSCEAHAHDARKWRQVRTILAAHGQISQRLGEELRRAGVSPDE